MRDLFLIGRILGSAVTLCVIATGCASVQNSEDPIYPVPRELEMTSHPTYRVTAPDILLIEAVNNVRRPESPLRTGDQVIIQIANGLPLVPPDIDPMANPLEYEAILRFEQEFKIINNEYLVNAAGEVDLGPYYGSFRIAGLTLEQAEAKMVEELKQELGLRDPLVTISQPDIAGKQAITGEHLVRPDGTVTLGIYGSVYVAGMTLDEVKFAVERHLSRFIHEPEVRVDVLAYNSQVYYVITDGGGFGEQVTRFPCTGNETVLDAVSQIQGLSQVSSRNIWVARPAPGELGCAQVMPVNWREIASEGVTTSNYQILPGDRVYIKADPLISVDNFLAKVIAPVERTFGVILLGNATVRNLQGQRTGFGGFGGFGGF